MQSSLAADEALLSFQVGLWKTHTGEDGGGAWVVAVTRDGARVHRLPDRTRLAAIVPMFAGLVEGGSASEADGRGESSRGAPARGAGGAAGGDTAARHRARRRPASPALRGAAPGAGRPAPLGPLRGRPCAVGHAVASLAIAASGRRLAPACWSSPTLRAADGSGATSPVRNAPPACVALRLGRLPFAREEARAIARHVGDVDALVGHRASERALKTTALGRTTILSISPRTRLPTNAPRAFRRAARAGRPAVRTACCRPGRSRRSISTGRIVVLSACQTAAGAILSGEGVLSLARAFFEAGAHAVIGSRWPLRDADAADLFDTFYRHLAEGATLSEALAATRTAARESGRPSSAWAGLVLLGNGDVRPFPTRPRPHRSPIGPQRFRSSPRCRSSRCSASSSRADAPDRASVPRRGATPG